MCRRRARRQFAQTIRRGISDCDDLIEAFEDRRFRVAISLCRSFENGQQPRGLGFDQVGQGLWSTAVLLHALGAELRQPLFYGVLVESFAQGIGKLVDDRLRRACRHEHRVERGNVKFGQALLVGSRHIRQQRAALFGGDCQRLDVSCLDLAQRAQHGIAFIIDLNAMLSGQVDYQCDPVLGTLSQVQAGNVKALAVAAKKRSPLLPDVPTSYEQGLPQFDMAPFYAVFVPTGTPQAIVDKLVDALSKGINEDAVKKRLAELGAESVEQERRGPKALTDLIKAESARLLPILKAVGGERERRSRLIFKRFDRTSQSLVPRQIIGANGRGPRWRHVEADGNALQFRTRSRIKLHDERIMARNDVALVRRQREQPARTPPAFRRYEGRS